MLYSHPAVEAITWWDFSDRQAWQRAPAGFLRSDMSPKPAYETLRRLVRDQWWTRVTETTDAQGRVSTRGTPGDYRLTVSVAGRPDLVRDVTLVRRGRNEFLVDLPKR